MNAWMPSKLSKSILCFALAYWIVIILGVLLTILFAIIFHLPSPQGLGVTASKAPIHLASKDSPFVRGVFFSFKLR